ncbi:hypothetical protein CDAR_411931 [Caerostris darwini]|uniref:Uncharacterized protein n=1 Tax=Caerostris darwini TaxID=1538125 RepID=A0AAV4WC97_9ARAC|nr:hypothetical protein CDAR_411931 [Caerostris darwini]
MGLRALETLDCSSSVINNRFSLPTDSGRVFIRGFQTFASLRSALIRSSTNERVVKEAVEFKGMYPPVLQSFRPSENSGLAKHLGCFDEKLFLYLSRPGVGIFFLENGNLVRIEICLVNLGDGAPTEFHRVVRDTRGRVLS